MKLLPIDFEDTLKTKLIGHPLYIYSELDSTQTTAKILAENGAKEGTTIFAYSQRKGMGRNGKKWFSPKGGVWFTIILRPSLSLQQTNIINVIFTTACAEVLHSFKTSKPTIKWPNDILINGKKICGILTQTKSGNEIKYALVGVGINLDTEIKDFPPELNNTATSLKNETGKRVKLDKFLKLLLEKIEEYYLMLKEDKSKTIQAKWENFSSIGMQKSPSFKTGMETKENLFLAVNIGNTNIHMGLFANKKLVSCLQTQTQKTPTNNYYRTVLKNLSPFENIKAVAICSVVASLTKPFQKLFKNHFKLEPIIIKEDLNLGIRLNYKKNQLGADRIANAVAAHYLYEKGCIVVDLGTAITFDIVSPKGIYLGGAIAPGISISSKALFSNTSLPNIRNSNDTKFAISKNTNQNLQTGILHGSASMLEGMLDKFKKKLDFKPLVILTGGDAKKISKMVNFPHIINPFLTLEGIRIIHERNI